jgi:hypothetical protein
MPTVVLPFLFAEEFGLDEVRALMRRRSSSPRPRSADARGSSAITASSCASAAAASARRRPAATIALWGALEGRRAVVLTIDPARRLANSLGIAELGDEPRSVDPALLATTGRPCAARSPR